MTADSEAENAFDAQNATPACGLRPNHATTLHWLRSQPSQRA